MESAVNWPPPSEGLACDKFQVNGTTPAIDGAAVQIVLAVNSKAIPAWRVRIVLISLGVVPFD
jgi:hypothetical protein